VALLVLPLLLVGIETFQQASGIEGGPATFLALFHTTFNLLGVLLLWPLTERLVKWLKKQFIAAEEDEAQPKFLDNTLIDTPELGHEALVNELGRIRLIAIRMAEDAINTEASLSPRLHVDLHVLHKLADSVGSFSTKLRRTDLSEEVAHVLPMALATSRYFIDVAEFSEEIDQAQSKAVVGVDRELEAALAEMRRQAIAILEHIRKSERAGDVVVSETAAIEMLENHYDAIKVQLLRAGTTGKLSARHMLALIEEMKNIERLVHYCIKGQATLQAFSRCMTADDEAESGLG